MPIRSCLHPTFFNQTIVPKHVHTPITRTSLTSFPAALYFPSMNTHQHRSRILTSTLAASLVLAAGLLTIPAQNATAEVSNLRDDAGLKKEVELLREELLRLRAENAELKKKLAEGTGKSTAKPESAVQKGDTHKITVESVSPLDRSELERSHSEAKEKSQQAKREFERSEQELQDARDGRGKYFNPRPTKATIEELRSTMNEAKEKHRAAEQTFQKFDRELRVNIMVISGRLDDGREIEVTCKGPFAHQAQRLALNAAIRVRGPIINSNGKRLELIAEDIDVVEPADQPKREKK
jgi:hypothetical protein